MNTTTRGGARRGKLGELVPVVGVALAVALGVAMVVGPSTSNLRARVSLVDDSASVLAGSPDATSQAGVTVQVRPRRVSTPAAAPVAPAALVTGDLGRVVRASTSPTDSTNSSARSTNVRIAPVSATPLLVSPSDLLAAPAALPPAPESLVAAAPTKAPTKALTPPKPSKTNSSTTPGPKAGQGSSSPLTGGAVAADLSPISGGGIIATAKAADKAQANAEKAADKAADKAVAPTKKDKA